MRSRNPISRWMVTAGFLTFLLLRTLPLIAQDYPETPQAGMHIEASVEVVPLSVMVTDRSGQAVTGLKKEDFKIYENGVGQEVSFFSSEKAPVSWGLVLDRSGSMSEMIQGVYRAALHVIDEGSAEDELFIATFNNSVELIHDFTADRQGLERSVVSLNAKGSTSLYDAVAFALDYIQAGQHQKKVLVVVTDGEDNSSRLRFGELLDWAGERNVLVYTAGMGEDLRNGIFGSWGGRTRKELKKLAEATGGTAHFPRNQEKCLETMRKIADDVSHQYSLAYYPTNPARDSQWRNIQVRVGDPQSTGPKYLARTRTGYYAPTGE